VREKRGSGERKRKQEGSQKGNQENQEKDGAIAQGGPCMAQEPPEAGRNGHRSGVQGVVQVVEAQEKNTQERRDRGVKEGEGSQIKEENGRLDGSKDQELEHLVDKAAQEGVPEPPSGRELLPEVLKDPLGEGVQDGDGQQIPCEEGGKDHSDEEEDAENPVRRGLEPVRKTARRDPVHNAPAVVEIKGDEGDEGD